MYLPYGAAQEFREKRPGCVGDAYFTLQIDTGCSTLRAHAYTHTNTFMRTPLICIRSFCLENRDAPALCSSLLLYSLGRRRGGRRTHGCTCAQMIGRAAHGTPRKPRPINHPTKIACFLVVVFVVVCDYFAVVVTFPSEIFSYLYSSAFFVAWALCLK